MENDDCTCGELHMEMEYQVVIFAEDKASKDFNAWYQGIFCKDYPLMADAFNFEFVDSPVEGRVLEIQAHDPSGFPVRALVSLFYAYRDALDPKVKERIELLKAAPKPH